MKSSYALLTLSMLNAGFSLAQTSPATKAEVTGQPVATDSSRKVNSPATRPNRRQELYDLYHGITKKPTPPPAPASTVSANQPVRPTESIPSEPKTVSGERTNPPKKIAPSSANVSTANTRIGIRGGINYPLYTEDIPLVDPTIGFVGGLVLNVGTGVFSFQPEINYARLSVKQDLGISSLKTSEDQIQVPLFLKIATGTYVGNRVFLNVGPYVAYNSSISLNGKNIDFQTNRGRLSYGAAAGLGTAIKAGAVHLTIEFRAYYQLGDNAKPSNGTSNVIPAQATLGYIIPLGVQ